MTSLSSFGIGGQQQQAQLVLELGLLGLELGGLGPKGRVLGGQLARGAEVGADPQPFPIRRDDRAELGVAPAERPGPVLVGVDAGSASVVSRSACSDDELVELLEHRTLLRSQGGPVTAQLCRVLLRHA